MMREGVNLDNRLGCLGNATLCWAEPLGFFWASSCNVLLHPSNPMLWWPSCHMGSPNGLGFPAVGGSVLSRRAL